MECRRRRERPDGDTERRARAPLCRGCLLEHAALLLRVLRHQPDALVRSGPQAAPLRPQAHHELYRVLGGLPAGNSGVAGAAADGGPRRIAAADAAARSTASRLSAATAFGAGATRSPWHAATAARLPADAALSAAPRHAAAAWVSGNAAAGYAGYATSWLSASNAAAAGWRTATRNAAAAGNAAAVN